MQQTETTVGWRYPDNLALTHRHHAVRYANPEPAYCHHRHNHRDQHQSHSHQILASQKTSNLYNIHDSQLHNHYRLQAAYCSFLLSHLNWTPGPSIKSTASQRQHTSCTTRSSRSSRSSNTSRTSRNTVVPDLLTLQRSSKQQQSQCQHQHYHHHCDHHHQQHHQHLRTRTDGCKAISVRLKPASCLPRPQLPSMQRISPPFNQSAQDIRAIVSNIVPPHASITSVQLLPHHSLQQVYEVKLSDASTMLVALPPQTLRRLMRVEQNGPRSEAVLIRWIREELLQPVSPPRDCQTPPPSVMRTQITPSDLPSISSVSSITPAASLPTSPSSTTTTSVTASPSVRVPRKLSPRPPTTPMHHGLSSHKSGIDAASMSAFATLRTDLLKYIPIPVSLKSIPGPAIEDRNKAPSPASHPLAFNVFRPTSGTPVTSLSSPLTKAERMAVDYQAGRLIRQLSQLAPQSGNFGPALVVLSPESQIGPANSPNSANDIMLGMGCWSVAFHTILEAILRDGEDVAVQLPYPSIRMHFRRLGHLLDSVTTPSLVVVDGMDDTNLLVERSPVQPPSDSDNTLTKPIKHRSASPTSPTTSTTTAADAADEAQEAEAAESYDESKEADFNNSSKSSTPLLPSPSPSLREFRASSLPPFSDSSSDIVVTGFRDWSHCIFGDPLFASVFCNQPSIPFMSGFNSMDSSNEVIINPLEPHAAHEETAYRSARLLLYQCYHAIVQIVRGFYHPGRDRRTQELAARKRLNEILIKLEAVDEDPKKRFRHRRPSGEMSPAKKPRSESGDDTPRR